MSVAILDLLRDALAALRDALDGDDASRIDAATAQVSAAVSHVRTVGAWRDEPVLRERIASIIPLMEAARIRTSLLADHTRQRIALLAEYGTISAPLTYTR
jgi:hypothetical protein